MWRPGLWVAGVSFEVLYVAIKQRVLFLESLIVDEDGGGRERENMHRGWFWQGTDTEWGVRKDMLRSDNEEFDVGCRFRDEDGIVIGIHKLDKWVGKKCVIVMVWCSGKRALRRF